MLLFVSVAIYILIAGLILSNLQRKYVNVRYNSYFKMAYFIICLPLLFILIFNDGCNDFYNYVEIFNEASLSSLAYTDQEYGYIILNVLIKNFISNGIVAVNIVRGLAFFASILAVFRLREKVDIGWAFIAFGLMAYFPIFSMPAYMLASACILLAFSFISDNKYIPGMIFIILAISLHYTAIFMVLPLLMYMICYKKEYPKKVLIWIMTLLTIVGVMGISVIYQYLISNIAFLYKYRVYSLASNGFGIKQFIDYIPIVLCLYFDKREAKNNKISNIALIMCILGFACGFAGYYVQNLTRIYTYFVYLFIVYIPHLIYEEEFYNYGYFDINDKTTGKIPFTVNSFKFVFLVYLAYRCVQFMSQVWYSSKFSEFHMFFGR